MMVPSKMGWGVAGGMLLVFLGCWNRGPYVDPDQQGDISKHISAIKTPAVRGLEELFSIV
jgi:hypothetical protein